MSGVEQRDGEDDPTAGVDVAPEIAPDPAAYDSPRAVQARARGLAAPYIAGGEDPDIERTRREERRYLRLLIATIVILVLSGFVLGALQKLLEQLV
jgi:hypothetical protein